MSVCIQLQYTLDNMALTSCTWDNFVLDFEQDSIVMPYKHFCFTLE